MDLVKNVDGDERCPYCERDDPLRDRRGGGSSKGWVELNGTITVHGTAYERGMTACRWCEAGVATYRKHSEKHPREPLETNYDESDLLLPPVNVDEGKPFTAEQRLAQRQAQEGAMTAIAGLFASSTARSDEVKRDT